MEGDLGKPTLQAVGLEAGEWQRLLMGSRRVLHLQRIELVGKTEDTLMPTCIKMS